MVHKARSNQKEHDLIKVTQLVCVERSFKDHLKKKVFQMLISSTLPPGWPRSTCTWRQPPLGPRNPAAGEGGDKINLTNSRARNRRSNGHRTEL